MDVVSEYRTAGTGVGADVVGYDVGTKLSLGRSPTVGLNGRTEMGGQSVVS
jgi:hypothetical protein